MKILHLAKYYWPRSGGMERVVQDLAEGAAELGHDVHVVAVEKLLGQRGAQRGAGKATRSQRSSASHSSPSRQRSPIVPGASQRPIRHTIGRAHCEPLAQASPRPPGGAQRGGGMAS